MEVVYSLWTYAILPFLISFFSAWLFWVLTFRYSNINIVFSDILEKRERETEDGRKVFLYRVRLSNAGRRDLIEVSIGAKVILPMDDGRVYATNFPVGDEWVNPMIIRKRRYKECKADNDFYSPNGVPKIYRAYFYGLYINDVAYKEFSKEDYDIRIRTKAKEKTLVLDDIFEVYPEAKLIIYVFGNDALTGARRKFESRAYYKKDIVRGRFKGIYENKDRYLMLIKTRGKKRISLLKEILSEIRYEGV